MHGHHLHSYGKGFCLAAVMDWFSRRVLAWRLSITMETDFCVEALQEAMNRYGKPDIFNTDQGSQFTAAAFIETPRDQGVQISMDGKGRFLDNIFIERLRRSLKYEEVLIKVHAPVAKARLGIGAWLLFYNGERKHPSLCYRTPSEIFAASQACGYVHNASALHTSLRWPFHQASLDGTFGQLCPQAQQPKQKGIQYMQEKYARKAAASDTERRAA